MAATMVDRRRFTVDEYYRMVDAGILRARDAVELIDGEVVVMSPIGPRHAACVSAAMRAMVLAARDDAIVQPQGPVRLDQFNEPQPDLMLLRPRADFYASGHAGPDDVLLVVEIADSSLRYDQTIKAGLYAQWGLAEYWLADLQNNRVLVHSSPEDGTYRAVDARRRGESIAARLLPSCIVPVDALLIE